MNRFYLFILMIFLLNQSLGQNQTDSCKITTSQQFDYSLEVAKNDRLLNATRVFANVLRSRDTTMMFAKEGGAVAEFMHGELFPSYLKPGELEYHFLNIGETKEGIVITVILRQDLSALGDEYRDMLYVLWVYRALISETADGFKLNCSLQTNGFQEKKSPFGRYLFESERTSAGEIKVSDYKKFAKEICKAYEIKPPKEKLTYIISDRNDVMKIFGFSYSLSSTAMFMKKTGLLLNVRSTYLDKHELTHYLTQSYDLSKFLSEGIAVYHGGSQGFSQDEYFVQQIKEFEIQSKEDQQTWLESLKAGNLEGGPYMSFFYAVSGKLIAEFVSKHGIKKLAIVMKESPQISPEQFIEKCLLSERGSVDAYLSGLFLTVLN